LAVNSKRRNLKINIALGLWLLVFVGETVTVVITEGLYGVNEKWKNKSNIQLLWSTIWVENDSIILFAATAIFMWTAAHPPIFLDSTACVLPYNC